TTSRQATLMATGQRAPGTRPEKETGAAGVSVTVRNSDVPESRSIRVCADRLQEASSWIDDSLTVVWTRPIATPTPPATPTWGDLAFWSVAPTTMTSLAESRPRTT